MNQSSEMALTVLMVSCLAGSEKDESVRVDDPVGPQLLAWSDFPYAIAKMRWTHRPFRWALERSAPGMYGFMSIRLRFVDDVVAAEAEAGIEQVVVLGAGYDTRAYRMADLKHIPVFEVDLPALSEDKQARVQDALGSLPENVTYVRADFNARQDLSKRLLESGCDPSAPTLFILVGVSMYLPSEALRGLFAEVAAFSHPQSSIVFDYVYQDCLEHPERFRGAKQWIKRAEVVNERLLCGLQPDELEGTLRSSGLTLDTNAKMTDLAESYLRRSDGSSIPGPWAFASIARARTAGMPATANGRLAG